MYIDQSSVASSQKFEMKQAKRNNNQNSDQIRSDINKNCKVFQTEKKKMSFDCVRKCVSVDTSVLSELEHMFTFDYTETASTSTITVIIVEIIGKFILQIETVIKLSNKGHTLKFKRTDDKLTKRQ